MPDFAKYIVFKSQAILRLSSSKSIFNVRFRLTELANPERVHSVKSKHMSGCWRELFSLEENKIDNLFNLLPELDVADQTLTGDGEINL